VYDKDGNRIFKMSLMDKALLAKWQEFDNQSPDKKLEILREWAEKHIPKDEGKSAGEKFAKLLDDLFDFLIALAAPNRDDEKNNERSVQNAA
jgi:hypothetical protein